MANLKELLVNGVSRFIGKVYINDSHITTINDVPVTENPKFTDTTDLTSMTGTLPVAHGGTGKTSAQDAANAFINALGTGSASSVPNDNDYFISQYINGGTSNTNYYRRPMNMFWEYIKGKISSILGLTATSYSGSAAKVNNHTVNADVPANAVFTDTTYTFDGTYNASTNKAATVSTVTNAINALDGGTIGTPSASKTLTALSQTNGNISATFSDISIGKSQITDFPTTMTPSSHTHGNIQNDGTLQTNDVAIENGDKLVVTDASNSNKVARTSVSFDGSTTTKALTQKGTWESFTNNAGTVTQITAGTGLSMGTTSGGSTSTSGTINHTNSVTAQTTQAIYPIKIDAQGHISAYGNAITPLTSHQTIKQDGITGATVNRFGTCDTAASTAAKTVNITTGTFNLEAGAKVTVKFIYANTASTPTLNVSSKGAKNIYHNGAQITSGSNKALLAGTVDFVYDGTQWHLVGNYIDTTYTSKTAASGGTDVSLVTTGEKYTWNNKTSNTGTVTSVQVQATSPVQSSTNTAQSATLNTTISLADGYGDTKNPYASKTKNYVLAAPTDANGAPSFRALDATDIPNLSWNKITSDKPTTLSGYGITDGLTIGTTSTTAMAGNTNVNNVSQTATTTSADYELLFSGTADNTTRNEGARKTSSLKYNPSTKALVTGGTVNGYTLAAASAKGVDTSISEGSTSPNLPTSAAVASLVSSAIAASDAMIFKGTLGTGGTVTALPTTYKTGWTYRVITAGTYAGNVCEIGDLVIALVDRNGSGNVNTDWTVAQTNVDGALTTAGGTVNGALDIQNELSANSATIGNMIVNGNAVFANGLTGNVTGNVSGSAGSVAWANVNGKPTATGSKVTGISISNHGTGTIWGVKSDVTTASKVTLGDAISVPNVSSVGSVTVPKAATSATTVPIRNDSITNIPNVTNAGSASTWAFENITVPIKNTSATTVPIAASSPTAVPVKNETATSIPNVTDVGTGSASLTFSMDETDTKKLIIGLTHTHTAPTLGTPISIYGVGADTINVTGVSGSTSVTGVQASNTTTASHVTGGGNGTAPTLGTQISIYGVKETGTSVTGVSGSVTASSVSLGSAISIPNVTNVTSVNVPIKNDAVSTFVTGATHTITDNGHTHSIT